MQAADASPLCSTEFCVFARLSYDKVDRFHVKGHLAFVRDFLEELERRVRLCPATVLSHVLLQGMQLEYAKDPISKMLQDMVTCGAERQSLRVMGEVCCRDCYLRVHDVTIYTWKAARTLYKDNTLEKAHALRVGRPAEQFAQCAEWMHRWINNHSVSTSRDGRKHLPMRPLYAWLYFDFNLEWLESGDETKIPSRETFRVAAKQALASISLPRGNADLKGCSTCARNVMAYEKAMKGGDAVRGRQIREEQAEHERVSLVTRHSYHSRREFAAANPMDVWSIVQDWTFPFMFPILHQRTAERDHCEKFVVNYWTQICHSERLTTPSRGVKFFWFLGGNGKDNGNANASALFFNVTTRREKGPLPPRAEVQLDSGSGGKCCVTIGVLAFMMESLGWFPDGIDAHFMISGHTGDDMDAVTAFVRYKCHTNGNWWSVDDVLEKFWMFYPNGGSPDITLFADLERDNNVWKETAFNRRFAAHFLYDWKAFLLPHMNQLAGITDKAVSRTEDSIHWWNLRLVNGHVELRVARRSVGAEAILSDPVRVFYTTPPRNGPSKIYSHDVRHAIAGGVDLQDVVEQFEKEQCAQWTDVSRDFLHNLKLELAMCKFGEPRERAGPKQPKSTAKRVADLTARPVLTAKPPKGSQEGGLVVAGDGSDDEEEPSSEDENFRDAAGDEEIEWEVQAILGKRIRRGKVQYLVRYVNENEESWQSEANVENAQVLVSAFEKEEESREQDARRRREERRRAQGAASYKEVNKALNSGTIQMLSEQTDRFRKRN